MSGMEKGVDWGSVEKALHAKPKESFRCEEPIKASWLQVLNLERSFYLTEFEAGQLSSGAVSTCMQPTPPVDRLDVHAAHTSRRRLHPASSHPLPPSPSPLLQAPSTSLRSEP